MSKDAILNKTAERLAIYNTLVLQKAEELLRSYQAKGSIKTLNDVAKTILCLDLSCSHLGHAFDRENGIKLSGLKKSSYLTNLHNVEKLLELNKPISIAKLCVQFNCTDVKELAEEILNKHMLDSGQTEILPQNVAAAIYVACKTSRIKIDQTELIKIGRIKPLQWRSLIPSFQSVITELENNKKHIVTQDYTENDYNPIEVKPSAIDSESYEEWKARILKEAYEALGS